MNVFVKSPNILPGFVEADFRLFLLVIYVLYTLRVHPETLAKIPVLEIKSILLKEYIFLVRTE